MKNLLLAISVSLFGLISFAQTNSPGETVTDYDGNVYHTVTIGKQTWLVENLTTTKYNDGVPISLETNGKTWDALTSGAYCVYKASKANDKKYGKLYNWYAVGTGKLAPKGWHVASVAEWSILNDYISKNPGFSGFAGKALAATTDWAESTDAGAIGNDLKKNNSSGFSALPGGGRLISGAFYMIEYFGTWWTSTELGNKAYSRELSSRNGKLTQTEYDKTIGLSVRCIRDDLSEINLKETESKANNTTKPDEAKVSLKTDIDCNKNFRGLEFVKNFRVCSAYAKMDKKLEESEKLMLHLEESETKLDLEIYSTVKEENNYKIAYSLCYIGKVLFLINLNISSKEDKGAANIESLMVAIKSQLGYFDSKNVDNQLIWTFDNYSAIIKKEQSAYNITFINRVTGNEFLKQEKTYKYNSGFLSH